jgi:acyl-coenzyme A synthetase/AMP-(fatty) acid ligase
MSKHSVYVLFLVFLIYAAIPVAVAQSVVSNIPTTSPEGYQSIKAEIVNSEPSSFTINVKFLINKFADTEAPIFAVYTSGSTPEICGDFHTIEIPYKKPSKYTRVFDLSEHSDVLKAIDTYQCVVLPNIPSPE